MTWGATSWGSCNPPPHLSPLVLCNPGVRVVYFCTLTLMCDILQWPKLICPLVYLLFFVYCYYTYLRQKMWTVKHLEEWKHTGHWYRSGNSQNHAERKREGPETKQRVEPPRRSTGQWELCVCSILSLCFLCISRWVCFVAGFFLISVSDSALCSLHKAEGGRTQTRSLGDDWGEVTLGFKGRTCTCEDAE